MSSNDALIRRCLPDDLPTLTPVYKGTDGPSLSFLSTLFGRATTQVWLLCVNDKPVGAAWFLVVADVCELVDIRLQAGVRGRGLGRLLLMSALKHFAAAGLACCHLEVRVSNVVAQALYDWAGFVETGLRPNYYPGPDGAEDAILMAMELDQLRCIDERS